MILPICSTGNNKNVDYHIMWKSLDKKLKAFILLVKKSENHLNMQVKDIFGILGYNAEMGGTKRVEDLFLTEE